MFADIRPARASDIDALISIENSVFGSDRLSRSALRRHVDSGTAEMLVAVCDGAPAGYALVFFRSGSRVARLYSIAVEPARAGAGLGRRLLIAAEGAATARECPILRLEVREDNARAIEFYERAGYRRIGREQAYYEDGAAALRFEKDVSRDR